MKKIIKIESEFNKCEADIHSAYKAVQDKKRWLDCPMIISIETYSKCNASCSFCPYVGLDRIGTKLSADRVKQLIDEISEFSIPPLRLNLSRINEPFLDPLLFKYLVYANRALPGTQLILFSNGSTLIDTTIDKLNDLSNFKHLTISFNEYDHNTYHAVMGLNQEKTLKRLDRLYGRWKAGELNFTISLSRVGTSNDEDKRFMAWCRKRFPGLPLSSYARFSWLGSQDDVLDDIEITLNAGCLQWFSLHILADGRSAFCCIDGLGETHEMNINTHSLTEMYNVPSKKVLRACDTVRSNVEGCRGCIHGMASRAFSNLA